MDLVKSNIGTVASDQTTKLKQERVSLLKRVFEDDRLAWLEMQKLRTRKLIARAINDKRVADAHKEASSLRAVGASQDSGELKGVKRRLRRAARFIGTVRH